MTAKIYSAALIGLDAHLIEVECDVGGNEFGKIVIVGLPDKAISESCERVKSAIKNSDIFGPRLKATVNLAPADIKKQGPAYDLPIAISILLSAESISSIFDIKKCLFIGELSLAGKLRPVNGVLSVVLMAKTMGIKKVFVPYKNKEEAQLIDEIEILPAESLREVVDYLSGIKPAKTKAITSGPRYNQANDISSLIDMSFIKGQEQAKRAMEIAAAGSHNILLQGPPGSGKTLIARAIPTILPQLTINESLEVTKIYSVSGFIKSKGQLVSNRPFRAPHHTASSVALVGGGTWPQPGEISLAHRGVLFLDEFPEFPRNVLENLRQPLEDGIINICRAANKIEFPAKFMLVAAMNPCACGYATDPIRSCTCSMNQIMSYKKRLSGPLLDRIDIQIEVPCLNFKKLAGEASGEKSADIRKRVEKVRQVQYQRFKDSRILSNSEMSSNQCDKFCHLSQKALIVLEKAMKILSLSNRSYYRTLKVSRTIADLNYSQTIEESHISEALQYRLFT